MPEARTDQRTARTRLEQCLARAGEVEPWLHSLVLRDTVAARARAEELDRAPDPAGALHGVVLAVKDNIDVAGQVTGCGSRTSVRTPAAADAPAVTRLREAGAVLLGRANMDEMAMGASTATSCHGPTRNPWDPSRSPGGSSGGCAAAVAAGVVDLALGTDTGGSVREPASQCGIWGLAPSPGLVPADGVVPFAPSCDRVGPLARDPDLLLTALEVLGGDHLPRPDVRLGELRVAVVTELASAVNRPGVLRALDAGVQRLRVHGVEVGEASVPDAPGALAAYLALTAVECLPHLGERADAVTAGHELVRRVTLARRLRDHDPARLRHSAQVRERLREQCGTALAAYDVLLSPTMPTTAPRFAPAGPPTREMADPMTAPYTDCWTVVANLAGLPALSVPGGLSDEDGMPIGLMLTGRPGSDALLVEVGRALHA